jgi:hypothetical protein
MRPSAKSLCELPAGCVRQMQKGTFVRIRKLVQTEQEVTINIEVSDICDALSEAAQEEIEANPGTTAPAKFLLNNVARALKAVSAEHIRRMEPTPRKMVREFLTEQAKRYEEPMEPGPHP